jgi:N-acetylglucosaminyl-diphospho-decaprenol L-rhamnosyltransferase
VSYGSDDELVPFLESVDAGEPVAVVVVDNLPGRGSVEEIVRRFGAGYIPLPDNPGYGRAINIAVRQLDESVEWVLISNPDVVLHPSALPTLLATGRSDDRIGSVGPLVRESSGVVYPSARELPSLVTGTGHALFARLWPGNPWTRRYHASTSEVERDAGWLSGSCLLVRRSAFHDVDGFDENFFMYFEDVDLGYRLTRAGWRNRYQPAAEVTHTGGHSTAGASSAMVRAHHASARRYIAKRYPQPILWPVRQLVFLSLSLRSKLAERRDADSSAR